MILKDKVALVLGAVKGIGKGLGLSLAAEGASVALTYHDWEDHLPSLKKDFAAAGVPHLIIRTDLRETNQVENLISKRLLVESAPF